MRFDEAGGAPLQHWVARIRHLSNDAARLLKKGALGEWERGRTLEECREWLRSGSALETQAGRRRLKRKGRNEADEEDRQKIEIDAVNAGTRERVHMMRADRHIRICLVARGEKLDDGVGVSPCIFNARLDARKRRETDGDHRHPDPRAF